MPSDSFENQRFNEANLRSTDAVRQHTVPRMYLREFAEAENLAAYDLQENREFVVSVNNAAVGSSFYNLRIGDLELSTEDWLADVEGRAAPILASMANTPEALLELSDEQENDLARYLAAQKFRVQAFRDFTDATHENMLSQIKPMARALLEKTLGPERAQGLLEEWNQRPLEWWLGETEPIQEADITTYMLSEVQGWANLLRSMAWRSGAVPAELPLYTSDNPMGAYLPPVRPAWSGGALTEHTYVFPLSPCTLLWLGDIVYDPKAEGVEPKGRRQCSTFSAWKASLARHITTASANRFVYGTKQPVPRQCATACLQRLDLNQVDVATQWQEFEQGQSLWPSTAGSPSRASRHKRLQIRQRARP